MKEMRFFVCSHCGNLVSMVNNAGVPMVCCGEKMKELVPNTVDAAAEKHVPVPTVEGNTVNVVVSEVEHPMTEPHFIDWICLQTEKGVQRTNLNPTGEPKATFHITSDDKAQVVFAYCNLHGLWKAEV